MFLLQMNKCIYTYIYIYISQYKKHNPELHKTIYENYFFGKPILPKKRQKGEVTFYWLIVKFLYSNQPLSSFIIHQRYWCLVRLFLSSNSNSLIVYNLSTIWYGIKEPVIDNFVVAVFDHFRFLNFFTFF